MSLQPPLTPQLLQQYAARAKRLLRIVECCVRSRNAIEKYSEMLAASTLSLFSVAPSLIAPFYAFVLRHWPRGYSDKVAVSLRADV